MTGDWDEAAARLADVASRLEAAGAEAIVLCTNTMHKLADELQAAVAIPLLHIADATGSAVLRRRLLDGRPAGDPVHHGAAVLRRPADRPLRSGIRWSRTPPAGPRSTASSMMSCAAAS